MQVNRLPVWGWLSLSFSLAMNSLTAVEGELIDLDVGAIDGTPLENNNSICMVGRLVADKDPHTYYLLDVLKKAWKIKNFTARE